MYLFAFNFTLFIQGSVASKLASSNYALSVVAEISADKSLENLAVRHNGNILVTSTSSPLLFQVSPVAHTEPLEIAEFPVTSLINVAELERDVFYVIATNLTDKIGAAIPNTTSIWEVDMRPFKLRHSDVLQSAKVSQIAAFPGAQLFNGLSRLAPNDTSTLLISDSIAGAIVKLNVHSGEYQTIIQDASMGITQATGFPIGINGIHTYNSDLYFMNTNQGLLAKFPISLGTGLPQGPITTVVSNTSGDDFIISPNGKKAWVAMNGQFGVVEVDIPEKKTIVVANSTLLDAVTALAFSRRYGSRDELYITTSAPGKGVNGAAAGQIVSMHLPYREEDLCS